MAVTREILCGCGKILARWDGKQLILYCKRCRKEIPVQISLPKAPGTTKTK